jgi:DNA-binding transcriptional LysR family regulator
VVGHATIGCTIYDALQCVRVDSELIARELATIRLWLCASHDYLSAHGTPQTMEDLRQHFLIGRMDGRMSWRFQKTGSTMEEFEFLPTTVISKPAAPKTLLIAGVGIDRCRRFNSLRLTTCFLGCLKLRLWLRCMRDARAGRSKQSPLGCATIRFMQPTAPIEKRKKECSTASRAISNSRGG